MRRIDMILAACAKTGLGSLQSVSTEIGNYAAAALNRIYEDVWHSYPFRDEKLVGYAVSVAADTEEVTLPQELDAIRGLRTVNEALYPINEIMLGTWAPDAFDETGTAYHYYNLANSPVYTQPSAASKITLASASASDTSIVVRVLGSASDVLAHEDITLNGTTPVIGAIDFTEILQITKPLTVGRVTVSEGASELGTLPAWDYQGAYRRIRLVPIPASAITLYVDGVRRFMPLTSDNDSVLLRRAESAIFEFLTAELYQYDDQEEKANISRQLAGEKLSVAKRYESGIDNEDVAFRPALGLFGDTFVPVDTTKTGVYM